ncbi:MAG: hypothetical protein U0800_05910 [Isosphaeraceae bacterium]
MRLRTRAILMACLLGLTPAASAQDGTSPSVPSAEAKPGKWFAWMPWNKGEGDVDLNRAVALSSKKPRGLQKLGQRLFGPSKPKEEMATSYSLGDVRVNGGSAQVLGPGSYKLNSKGWQSSKSPYSR